MHFLRHCVRAALIAVPILALASNTFAQATDASRPLSFEFSLTPLHQLSVNVEGGGEFAQRSTIVRMQATRSISPTASIGLNLKYDADDYTFSGAGAFAGARPWGDVRRVGLSVPMRMRLTDDWSLGVAPSIDWIGERDADSGDAVSYGLTVFALKSLAPGRSLGLGAGVFRTIDEDVRGFPFIAVNWRVNERWRVTNPFDADALGPAGLELIYRFNDRWRLGGGAVYRSLRFRLDDEGVAPGGIGENRGVVSFFRLRRQSRSGIDVDVYAGAVASGKLELKNSNGNDLSAADYDAAPFVAATLRMAF